MCMIQQVVVFVYVNLDKVNTIPKINLCQKCLTIVKQIYNFFVSEFFYFWGTQLLVKAILKHKRK